LLCRGKGKFSGFGVEPEFPGWGIFDLFEFGFEEGRVEVLQLVGRNIEN
jgi:hypothetical protein